MENGQSQHAYSCSITKMILPKLLDLMSQDKDYANLFMVKHKIKNEKKN